MKKLIPALCMLLIAAALMGTSTFAWFSMNTKVSATGMQVKAATASSLVISNTQDSGYSNSASTTTGALTLTPCSTADGKSFFYNTNPTKITSYTDGALTSESTFAKATTNTYISTSKFYVKVQGTDTTGYSKLYVSNITITDNNGGVISQYNDISKALRVSVKGDADTAYIYAPVAGYTAAYKGVVSAEQTGEGALSSSDVTITTVNSTDANLLGSSVTSSTEKEITVTVWYEGQDTACTSANSVNVQELKVQVDFAAAQTN